MARIASTMIAALSAWGLIGCLAQPLVPDCALEPSPPGADPLAGCPLIDAGALDAGPCGGLVCGRAGIKYVCLDIAEPDGVPAGSPACSAGDPCAPGYICLGEAVLGRCLSTCSP